MKWSSIENVIGRSVLGLLALLVLLLFISLFGAGYVIETPYHLALGWILLPIRNLPEMSWNGGTVLSGITGLALALLALQFCGRRFVKAWTWRTSVTFTAVLPIVFFMAFWLPGILAMAQGLTRAPFFIGDHTHGDHTDDLIKRFTQDLGTFVRDRHSSDETYPARLSDVVAAYNRMTREENPRYWYPMPLPEGEFFYPSSGLPPSRSSSVPLLISPLYITHFKPTRYVVAPDGTAHEIQDSELPALLAEVRRQRDEILSAKKP